MRRGPLAAWTAVAAVVLLAAAGPWIARHAASRSPARTEAGAGAPRVVTLEVGGMGCMDCVGKVRASIARVEGVRSVDVDLASQRATVVCAGPVADTSLTAAVRHAGEGYIGLVIRP